MKIKISGSAGRLVAVGPMLLALALLAGCSKAGPGSDISSSAFAVAPPPVKELWDHGLAAWKDHRYAEAATNIVALRGMAQALSPQQAEALTKAGDAFGQEVFAAAEKGDAGAAEAVKTLRSVGGRRGGAAR